MIKCHQPGCNGSIEDGYCNVCGMPPSATVPPAVPAVAATAPPGTTPARTGTTSTRLASTLLGSARGSKVTHRLSVGSSRTHAARLGAGITTVPSAPVADPRSAVQAHPEVAENKRFCAVDGTPVGRGRPGHPARAEGFCPKCGTPFSFAPKLKAGDLVGGQYMVTGCIAHGGLGWIYLAQDKNVSDRWVVLKGLLNSGDQDAYDAAVAERKFLAEVEHPLILGIYNFVQYQGAGYIIMEYVGGKSLKDILKDRQAANGGKYDPIPVDQALAYMIEILPAFSYLHDNGLVYCDFKPDNVIQMGDSLKLIDLGGVRRIDDVTSAIYGTGGYQAPEVPDVGPSVAGDIYTIGRTLAVMIFEFRGYQKQYIADLPPVADVPVFQQYDSLYRLLAKATAANPNDRFQSADELREQMLGVLREVVAQDAGQAVATHSTPSSLFETPTAAGATLEWPQLPRLRADTGDPMAAWLAGVSVPDPEARLRELGKAAQDTPEVKLARIMAAIEGHHPKKTESGIADMLSDDPWEWRAVWLQGLAALADNNPTKAIEAFNAVYGQVPGELAPKLALAWACELTHADDIAEKLYEVCARTDASYTPTAAFGLARIRSTHGDNDGALVALDMVATTSRAYVDARRQRAALLVASHRDLNVLAQALDSIAAITIDPKDRQLLTIQVLEAALTAVQQGGQASVTIGGIPAREGPLRAGAEKAYRELAALTIDQRERIALVDLANKIRPRTRV